MIQQNTSRMGIGLVAAISALLVGCSDGPCESTSIASSTDQATAAAVELDPSLAEAVKNVLSHTPPSYPDDLTVVEEEGDYASLTTNELMAHLGNWNPALRRRAADVLARRGDEVLPRLTEALQADDANLRAGAAMALSGLVSHQLRNWQEAHPEITDRAEAHAKIRGELASLLDVFIKLTKDRDRDVRDAAMGALATMAPDSPEAARTVLAMCSDSDVYLAAAAFIRFEKHFDPGVVGRDELLMAIRATLDGPFPRSKGHAFRLINKMDDAFQRELIPEYIEHLDWQPMRDTMFGAGGQAEAVRLCAKFKVRELLPRLTTLMDKSMRGPGLFQPCVEAIRTFGKDAKPILPELKEYIEQMEARRMSANPRRKDGIQKGINQLKEAVDYVENL